MTKKRASKRPEMWRGCGDAASSNLLMCLNLPTWCYYRAKWPAPPPPPPELQICLGLLHSLRFIMVIASSVF